MAAANWLIDHVLETTEAGWLHREAILDACSELGLYPYRSPVRYRAIRAALLAGARTDLDDELSQSVSAYREVE